MVERGEELMIAAEENDVGETILAYCTSCKMDLNHVVVAKKNDEVKRVSCLTCQKEHNYRAPKGKKAEPKKPAAEKSKPVRSASSAAARKIKAKATRDEQAWIEAVGADSPQGEARTYGMTEAYQPGELIQHPVFGLGRVHGVQLTGKMQVIFRGGVRLLACRRLQGEQRP
jgi:hypothetical protein